MLLLTRKIGQQVVLPDQGITIDVVDVCRTHVRLGITAPVNILVHRREVWDRVLGSRDGLPPRFEEYRMRTGDDEEREVRDISVKPRENATWPVS